MAAQRRPLIAGNWKMNGLRAESVALARTLVERGQRDPLSADVAIFPPATAIAAVGAVLEAGDHGIALGGQDCATAQKGAHTGDVAAAMLADLGCRYVIVGHSERRKDHGESNRLVQAKAVTALAAGLIPIVCIGESQAERAGGKAVSVVRGQLGASLPALAAGQSLVVAYEPVWAIGSGQTPTPAEIAEVHDALRRDLSAGLGASAAAVRVLYGGSVKSDNAASIFALPGVDGALVGGASLKADEFWAICVACATAKARGGW